MYDKNQNKVLNAEEITQLFLQHQRVLMAYIRTLVADRHRAEDVLQETAMILIRRASEFGSIKNFWALAREIARRQSILSLQREKRSPRILPDTILNVIDVEFNKQVQDSHWDAEALHTCIHRLPDVWMNIVKKRYWLHQSVTQIFKEFGRSVNTISVTLNRARSRLAECLLQKQSLGGDL